MALHVRTEVVGEGGRVSLVRDSEHVRPEGVDGGADKATIPVKPLSPVSVIVELPRDPGMMEEGVTGPADT